jgi:hypothetical protein
MPCRPSSPSPNAASPAATAWTPNASTSLTTPSPRTAGVPPALPNRPACQHLRPVPRASRPPSQTVPRANTLASYRGRPARRRSAAARTTTQSRMAIASTSACPLLPCVPPTSSPPPRPFSNLKFQISNPPSPPPFGVHASACVVHHRRASHAPTPPNRPAPRLNFLPPRRVLQRPRPAPPHGRRPRRHRPRRPPFSTAWVRSACHPPKRNLRRGTVGTGENNANVTRWALTNAISRNCPRRGSGR